MPGWSYPTVAMVGKTNGEKLMKEHGDNGYQEALEQTFVNVGQLKSTYDKDIAIITPAAIGMYTHYDRLATCLRQLMTRERKLSLDLIERSDFMTLTREAAEISGIP
ncbi:hypothetical protein ACFLW3_00420 [Chloroflexota bacterium]